jgi:hypothetical protein
VRTHSAIGLPDYLAADVDSHGAAAVVGAEVDEIYANVIR